MKTIINLLLLNLVLISNYTYAQSNTGIDWDITPQELIAMPNDTVVSDKIFPKESDFSFDTIESRVITINKTFWDLQFYKTYRFENNRLTLIEITVKPGEINYENIGAKIFDYRAYYIRMFQALYAKYGDPTSESNTNILISQFEVVELCDEGKSFDTDTEWKFENETIKFEFSYFNNLNDLVWWNLHYELNSNLIKKEIKEQQKELMKKKQEEIKNKKADDLRKQEADKISKDI